MRDGRLLGYLLLVPERLFIVPVINVLWSCRLLLSQRDRRGSAIQAADAQAFRQAPCRTNASQSVGHPN